MLDVPRSDSQEPRLRIPVPPGWEQPPALDPADDTIRMAILNPGLAADGFTPNAVVALNRISAEGADAQQILDAQNEILVVVRSSLFYYCRAMFVNRDKCS